MRCSQIKISSLGLLAITTFMSGLMFRVPIAFAVDGACTPTCSNNTVLAPSRAASEASCRTDCETRCRALNAGSTGTPVTCRDPAFVPGSTTAPDASTRTEAPAPSTSSINAPHNPFGNTTIPDIIGRVIRFLLGIAGALFLAMFVYGGAVWMTAGSSDRVESAQKTLVNSVVGVLIILLSYTILSLVLRFASTVTG